MASKYFKRELYDVLVYPAVFLGVLWVSGKMGWINQLTDETLMSYLIIGTVASIITLYVTYKKFYKR